MGCNGFVVKNEPLTYQKSDIKVFREYIDVFIFLDDFIVFNDLSIKLEKIIKCFF